MSMLFKRFKYVTIENFGHTSFFIFYTKHINYILL